MPPKIETLAAEDVKLQAEILQLGKDLAARRTSSMRLHGQKQATPEEIAAGEERLLQTIRSLPVRRLLGIRANFVTENDVIRLRTLAYIGWEMLTQTSPGTQIEAVTAAIADPKKPFCEQVLLVRDALARMTSDRNMLVLSPETGGKWGGRILLCPRVYSWLAGGHKSRADFCPAKQASDRLKSYGERDGKAEQTAQAKVPTAKEIYDAVCRKAVGVEPQARLLASRMALHLLRCEAKDHGSAEQVVGTQVAVILGESGVGKSYVAEALAVACKIPKIIFPANTLTSEGYIGGKVDDIFRILVASTQGDVKAAEKGSLVILDEADKLDLRGDRSDVATRAVQAELLMPIQGCEFLVGKRQSDSGRSFMFDSGYLAWCLLGCFPDVEKIVERLSGSSRIGFATQAGDRSHPRVLDALREYFLDELVNRVSCVVALPSPREADLRVATSGQIQAGFNDLLRRRDIVLHLKDEAVRSIASYASESRTYYRGCKQVVGDLVSELLYDSKPDVYLLGAADVRRAIDRLANGTVIPEPAGQDVRANGEFAGTEDAVEAVG